MNNLSAELKERKAIIIEALDKLEVDLVEVRWSGSGDSGQVDGIDAKDTEQDTDIDLSKTHVTMKVVREESVDSGRKDKKGVPIYIKVKKTEDKEMNLSEAIEQFSYDLLDETNAASFDNDGAQGSLEFTWDKKTKQWTVHYSHSFNVVNEETQHDEDI